MDAKSVYQLARNAGLAHEPAIIATAIAWGESDLNPEAVGDVNLQDATWGPSIGLWQVRSLKSQSGSGQDRDATRLKDPQFNARSMAVISNGGTKWTPWTIYKNGAYAQYLDRIRAVVSQEKVMEIWHPNANIVEPINVDAYAWSVDVPYKLLFHTTEGGSNGGGRSNYHGHQSYPHFECREDGFDQFFDYEHAGKALWNEPGGVQTNGACVIQIEIVGRAASIQDISDKQLGQLADIATHVRDNLGVELKPPPQGWAESGAAADGRLWFSGQDWYEWNGCCGHTHVPENSDRWDPGDFPWDRFAKLVGATTKPIEEEKDEDTMIYATDSLSPGELATLAPPPANGALYGPLNRYFSLGHSVDGAEAKVSLHLWGQSDPDPDVKVPAGRKKAWELNEACEVITVQNQSSVPVVVTWLIEAVKK